VPATPPSTAAPDVAPATSEAPADGAMTLDGVRTAVVQIEAKGTFVDPEFGSYEGAGRGSGFVIDGGNVAVTNNHVVTGAGLLQVYVDGEDDPRNARVLGVSECSDLAVIQIDGPDIPALTWADGADQPGTEVYVAGFPLGDPEYTLTRGVISKAEANGDTNWASIDHTLEHDAAAQPGNSGGPLVTVDGEVAGIHYASAVQTNQSQFLAIAADVAQPIVETLASGQDDDSIGVNGQVVVSEDGSISGIWVSGVDSGSVADEAGIQPGDIITRIEGVSIGTDGTMREYCDVLRSHAPDDQLAIEVLRFSTSEFLDGELNGDVLTQSFSFAEEYADETAGDAASTYDYVTVTDDTGTITVKVPSAWNDLETAPIDIGFENLSPSITASSSIDGYRTTWATPGMEFIASPDLLEYTSADLLDALAPEGCVSEGRTPYDDGYFVGEYEVFSECGGTDTQYYLVASTSASGEYGAVVAVQVVSDADLDALDRILASFNVTV
ncbi:MAG: peptidase S1, partial [Acidimicrobiaceae bacterium]|nr:peptidase S1 [Acidimicrobiaceae bacterium]